MSVMTGYEISQKNGLSTWKLIGLTIITGVAFCIYWMKKITELVEAFSGKRVWKDSTFIVVLFLFFGLTSLVGFFWGGVLGASGVTPGSEAFYAELMQPLDTCRFLSVWVVIFMVIQWSFSMRREITLYAITKLGMSEYKMNAFYTLIFNVAYINYCLNDLGDEDLLQRAREDQRVRQMKNSELQS